MGKMGNDDDAPHWSGMTLDFSLPFPAADGCVGGYCSGSPKWPRLTAVVPRKPVLFPSTT